MLAAFGVRSIGAAQPAGRDTVTGDEHTSVRDPVLNHQLERLSEEMRAFSDQMNPAPATAMSSAPGQSRPELPDARMESPGLTCPDCPRELGLLPSSIGAADASAPMLLPGFPGAPHLYHLGAADFFLDRVENLELSVTQRVTLGRIRESALMARANRTRELEEADQVLFQLTGADQPDAEKIETQVRRIEALRRARRLAFIRAVGEAAQVLTEDQRRIVAGAAS